VKNAFAANAAVILRPLSSKKSVLIPQIRDEARVLNDISTK
jgi:hypothetical protein